MTDTSTACLNDNGTAPTLGAVAKRKPIPIETAQELPLLRRLREKRGLTQQAVADRIGTSQQNVDRMEKRPVGALSVEQLLGFAGALDLPPMALIDSESYDDIDTALMQVARRLGRAEKARLLTIANAFEVPLKIA